MKTSHLECGANIAVYILGGRNESAIFNSVYTFNTNTWNTSTQMPVALFEHSVVALDDTTMLMCGGLTAQSYTSAQATCYSYRVDMDGDIGVPEWTVQATMNTRRCGHGMVMYKGGLFVKPEAE
jgi:hypothetical protein